jgi:hypothetical protein
MIDRNNTFFEKRLKRKRDLNIALQRCSLTTAGTLFSLPMLFLLTVRRGGQGRQLARNKKVNFVE